MNPHDAHEKALRQAADNMQQKPPTWVWDNVEQHLNETTIEEHRPLMPWEKSLKNISKNIISPPQHIWQSVNLSIGAGDTYLEVLTPWEKSLQTLASKTTVPPNIWKIIEGKLDKKKRRTLLPFWFAASAVLLLLIVGVWHDSYRSTKTEELIFTGDSSNLPSEDLLKGSTTNKVSNIQETNTGQIVPTIVVKNKKQELRNKNEKNVIDNSSQLSLLIEDKNKEFGTSTNSNKRDAVIAPITIHEFSENKLASLQSLNKKSIELDNVKLFSEIKCPDFSNRKRPSFFIEGNLLVGKHNRSFAPVDSDQPNLSNLRKETELPIMSYGINMLAGLYLNRHFYAATGISYVSTIDKFKYSYNAIDKIIIDIDPITQQVIDTSYIYTTITTQDSVKYSHIDLPLVVGYEYFTNGWAFGIEAGVILNLKTSNYGRNFNQSFQIADIYSQGDITKTNLGLGGTASLVLKRYLTSDLSVHVKPGYRTYFGDWNSPNYPVKMKSDLIFVNIGLRKVF